MRTTVCYRKTEITMRVGAILIEQPCYSILETGEKKKSGNLVEKLLNGGSFHTILLRGKDLHTSVTARLPQEQ